MSQNGLAHNKDLAALAERFLKVCPTILGYCALNSCVAGFLVDLFKECGFLKYELRVTSYLGVTLKLRVTSYFCWNCKLRIASSTLKLQVTEVKCQLNFEIARYKKQFAS